MYIQALLMLTGSAQKLSTAIGTFAPTGISGTALAGLACREIHIQSAASNSHVVYFGDSLVSASLYAFMLPIPVTSVPCAPMIMGPYGGDVIRLGDIYAIEP